MESSAPETTAKPATVEQPELYARVRSIVIRELAILVVLFIFFYGLAALIYGE